MNDNRQVLCLHAWRRPLWTSQWFSSHILWESENLPIKVQWYIDLRSKCCFRRYKAICYFYEFSGSMSNPLRLLEWMIASKGLRNTVVGCSWNTRNVTACQISIGRNASIFVIRPLMRWGLVQKKNTSVSAITREGWRHQHFGRALYSREPRSTVNCFSKFRSTTSLRRIVLANNFWKKNIRTIIRTPSCLSGQGKRTACLPRKVNVKVCLAAIEEGRYAIYYIVHTINQCVFTSGTQWDHLHCSTSFPLQLISKKLNNPICPEMTLTKRSLTKIAQEPPGMAWDMILITFWDEYWRKFWPADAKR